MHFPRDFRSTIRRDTPSTGDAEMLLSHAMVSVASVCFSLSAAFAQQPAQMANSGVKLPTRAQSLIEREWLANFYLAQVNHGFSCPIGISSDGTLSFKNCTTAKYVTIARPPSGMMTIDRTCHVVGSITYVFTDDQWGGGTAQESFSLWRSSDGSRLSGTRHFVCCDQVGGIPQAWVGSV
jgi:hypothetical protein